MAKNRTIAGLKKELADKEKQLHALQSKRDQLTAQLRSVDQEIASLLGKPAAPRKTSRKAKKTKKKARKPGKSRVSLADVLASALKGKGTIRVSEAAKMAKEAGYRTRSKQFANIVAQTLASDKRFEKVQRGTFRLKA